MSTNHSIDFKNCRVINKGSSCIRKTLESWHTTLVDHADNNSRLLPNQYSILLKKNNCDPPRDFREQGERTHTARSHAKTKELAFNTLAAC